MIGLKIFYLIILLPIGFFFTFKTEAIYDISWYSKHGVDEEGKQQFLTVWKYLGIFCFVIAVGIIISFFF